MPTFNKSKTTQVNNSNKNSIFTFNVEALIDAIAERVEDVINRQNPGLPENKVSKVDEDYHTLYERGEIKALALLWLVRTQTIEPEINTQAMSEKFQSLVRELGPKLSSRRVNEIMVEFRETRASLTQKTSWFDSDYQFK